MAENASSGFENPGVRSKEEKWIVQVAPMSGDIVATVEIDSSTTVRQLLDQVPSARGFSGQLLLDGRIAANEEVLSEIGVVDGSVVTLHRLDMRRCRTSERCSSVLPDCCFACEAIWSSASICNVTYLRAAIANGGSVEVKGQRPDDGNSKHDEFTVLMMAADRGKPLMVEVLLEAGADSEARSSAGMTALNYAVTSNRADAIEVLLEARANIEAREGSSRQTFSGLTPLLRAAINGRVAPLRVLLRARADVEATNHDGKTALALASVTVNVASSAGFWYDGEEDNRGDDWNDWKDEAEECLHMLEAAGAPRIAPCKKHTMASSASLAS
eukprot:TRINITY_DN33672_c0_g1_i1.p1 TRINITY_DN33672_c0_g1~~TRINITY_DN33672_c0_g1_i1.p1  ORF type:complete len:336 (+),score=63.79 TRINITY_DN33672_c0_g1_i1:22-1008(+)